MTPDTVILPTAQAVKAFEAVRVRLPMADELETCDTLNYMFDYLTDFPNAQGNITEFANSIAEQFVNRYDESAIQDLMVALGNLGQAVYDVLKALKMYDHQGACWYTYERHIFGDVIVRRVTKEDLIN